jgi:hypothetical protein
MPARSKSQQRFFGMISAYKKGKLKHAPKRIRDAAKHISKEDADDFARTKHDGLPEKKEKAAEMTRYEEGFLSKCAEHGIRFDVSLEFLRKNAGYRDLDPASKGAIVGGAAASPLAVAMGASHYYGNDLIDAMLLGLPRRNRTIPLALRSVGAGGVVLGTGVAGGALIGKLVQRIRDKRMAKMQKDRGILSEANRQLHMMWPYVSNILGMGTTNQ